MNLLLRLKRLAEILRRARSNQPYCTSEEAYAQMERMTGSPRVKWQATNGER
jgi:hypothetical protein